MVSKYVSCSMMLANGGALTCCMKSGRLICWNCGMTTSLQERANNALSLSITVTCTTLSEVLRSLIPPYSRLMHLGSSDLITKSCLRQSEHESGTQRCHSQLSPSTGLVCGTITDGSSVKLQESSCGWSIRLSSLPEICH